MIPVSMQQRLRIITCWLIGHKMKFELVAWDLNEYDAYCDRCETLGENQDAPDNGYEDTLPSAVWVWWFTLKETIKARVHWYGKPPTREELSQWGKHNDKTNG